MEEYKGWAYKILGIILLIYICVYVSGQSRLQIERLE